MRRLCALVMVILLGGCAVAARETPEERAARLQGDCTAAGFQPATEAFRLCLLLQQQDERLAALERRLGFIEQDVRLPPLRPYRYWP